MRKFRLVQSLLISLAAATSGQSLANNDFACPDGFQRFKVKGHASSQSVDQIMQKGFLKFTLSSKSKAVRIVYKGTYTGMSVGYNDVGMPLLDHKYRLFHQSEGHVSLWSRGDTVVDLDVIHDCGDGSFAAKATETISSFPYATGSLQGVQGELTAVGMINEECSGRNSFKLKGVLCLPSEGQ